MHNYENDMDDDSLEPESSWPLEKDEVPAFVYWTGKKWVYRRYSPSKSKFINTDLYCGEIASREELLAAVEVITGSKTGAKQSYIDQMRMRIKLKVPFDIGLKTPEQIIRDSRPFSRRTGVYFLLKNREIVYVGKSKHFTARINNHETDSEKDFDSVFFIPLEEKYIKKVESYYIQRINPKLNKTFR